MVQAEVEAAVLLGNQRTPTQDVGFVVNRLGAALARIAWPPVPRRYQHDGKAGCGWCRAP